VGILVAIAIKLTNTKETPVRPQPIESPPARTEPPPTKESPILTQKPVSPPPEKDGAESSTRPKESTSKPGIVLIPAGELRKVGFRIVEVKEVKEAVC
jgi:hypothetical protein